MRTVEFWLLAYLLNSLWQLPLLFAAGWLAARALRSAGPAAAYRIWGIVLLLQSVVPALSALPWAWLRLLHTWAAQGDKAGRVHVSVLVGAGTQSGALSLPAELLATVAILYAVATGYFLARFCWRLQALSAMRAQSITLNLTGKVDLCWARCANRFDIQNASAAVSSTVFGPVTVGVRRKVVLLPANFADLPEADLLTVFAHEFAHLRRNDFLKNLFQEALSLPVSYHPVLSLTRERLSEAREMICDRMAAELDGPPEYAQSLLRLASLLVVGAPARVPHAIGIFDANTFERRLMQLSANGNELRGMRRAAVFAACAALGAATCASAMALGARADAPAAEKGSSTAKASAPHTLTIPSGVMAGNARMKVNPIYPEAAKKAKIQGTVVLDAVISTEGAITGLQAVSGPVELRQSALDAVRQWTYEPYLLNGDPIEVKTTVNVTYSLAP